MKTITELLAPIEERLNGQLARCIGSSFNALQDARFEFANNAPDDIKKLLEVVREYDETLKEVIRNSKDILAKKHCSRAREAAAKILSEEK